jgi:hypothetical protein
VSYHTSYYSLDYPVETIAIGQESYTRINGGPWRDGDVPEYLFPLGPPPRVGDLLGLLSYALDGSLVGVEELNGVPARHLRFILRPEVLPGTTGPFEGLAGGNLWVDAGSHRFLRLELIVDPARSPERNRATITITFSDYDAALPVNRPRSAP